MLTKEHPSSYEIYAKKAGKKPRDNKQWKEEKQKTEQQNNERSQPRSTDSDPRKKQ